MAEPTLTSAMVASADNELRACAFNLALIEKVASTLGTMNFIWATAVLLGGFSQSLRTIDFLYVSLILAIEGLRILCRRGELATRPSASANFNFRNFRLYSSSFFNFNLPLIRLYSLLIQVYSAAACILLSSIRLYFGHYGSSLLKLALILFYSLSLVESFLTLFGFILRWSLSRSLLFMDSRVVGGSFYLVLRNGDFGDAQLNMFGRYFYDAYFRCINGSVFDALKDDFLSYGLELLQSTNVNKQLDGAGLLYLLLISDSLDSEKLRVIRTMPGVLERLIELLSWEKPEEKNIRTVAGQIICKLVQIPGHRIRVMAIPESWEFITSLLGDTDQIVLGKQILKFLAEDPDNHAKIGGLRHKIITLAGLDPNMSESDIILHLRGMETETRTDQQDVGENIEGTSRVEAEHSDDPTSQSVDRQV